MKSPKKFIETKSKLTQLFHTPPRPIYESPAVEKSRQGFLDELQLWDEWKDDQIPKGPG